MSLRGSHRALPVLSVILLSFVGACAGRGLGLGAETVLGVTEPMPLELRACEAESVQGIDVDSDGRPDIQHFVGGGVRVCSLLDINFDGRPDIRRFYEVPRGEVAFEQYDFDFDGNLDQQVHYRAGKVASKELDTDFDGWVDTWVRCRGPLVVGSERARRKPGRIDTWEKYDAQGSLTEVRYDDDSDGLAEKFEVYRMGQLVEVRFDTDLDGEPDESQPVPGEQSRIEDRRVSCDGSPLPKYVEKAAEPPPPAPTEAEPDAADEGEPEPSWEED